MQGKETPLFVVWPPDNDTPPTHPPARPHTQPACSSTALPSSPQLLRRTKYRADGMLHFFTIGNGHIKTIEGRFGSSVASFFTFLRWICALNLVLSLTVVGFLMVPQVSLNTYIQTDRQTHKAGSHQVKLTIWACG